MEGIWAYLERIIGISSYSITIAGDVPNVLNRWLIKSELADGTWPDQIEPCLYETKAKIVLEHEKASMTEQELKSNWRFHIADRFLCQYNTPDKFLIDDKDRYIHSLCSVYCENERDVLIFIHSERPMKMWINGRMTYSSKFDFHIQPGVFVYRFKRGFNTILLEKELSQRYKSLNMELDENIIILKPCAYLLHSNVSKFFDKELLEDLDKTYSIIPDRSFYRPGQKIDITVLCRSMKASREDRIKVTASNTVGEEIASIITETAAKISLEVDLKTRGMLCIKAESITNPEKYSILHVFYGDFKQSVEQWINNAEKRDDCNPEIIATVKRLQNIPQVETGLIRGAYSPLTERLLIPLMEKLFEFERYTYSVDGPKKKEMLDVFQTNALLFRNSEVDEGFKCYSIYLPQGYDPLKKYPLVIYMQFGFGMNMYPTIPSYIQNQHFKDAIALNLCGRVKNRDYISEGEFISIINKVIESLNIDRDRIFIIGTCAGAFIAFDLALKIPHLFTAIAIISGSVRLDINEPEYDQLENIDNTMVCQLGAIEELMYNCSRFDETLNHIKKNKKWWLCYFSHGDVEELLNRGKLQKMIIRQKKVKYPKEIRYTTYEPIYNKSYWLEIDYIENLSSKAFISGSIQSENLIVIKTENIRRFNILVSTKHMGIGENIVLCVNNIRQPIYINKYARISVTILDAGLEIKSENLSWKDFDSEYNRVGLNEQALGIKEVYLRKCIIIKPDSNGGNRSTFVRTLC
ncbi:MAG TPA: hypothetical protein VHP38_01955, partial [Ruminiclostridium sp.]|nr:hypothetical protein [Ruminiclostridium sp.]